MHQTENSLGNAVKPIVFSDVMLYRMDGNAIGNADAKYLAMHKLTE